MHFFSETEPGRKGEIMDAAVTVFHARGYDGGSMREIAEAVGISEPGLYRHFASKQDLFEQILETAGGRMLAEIVPMIDAATAHNVREVIDSVVAERRRAMQLYLPVIQTAMIASMHNPVFLRKYRSALIMPLIERVSAMVALLDSQFGITVPSDELPGRVRVLVSIFVGYFITGIVLEDAPMAAADIIVRVMGWEAAS